jgi:DNA-binding transcriptional MerR regulator
MVEQRTRTAGQVARLLDVPESTLRAWHRRYGVGPAAPRPGAHRRYTEEDVARLLRMRDLIRAGALPSDAARRLADGTDARPPAAVLPELLAAAADLDNACCLRLLERSLAGHGVVRWWEDLCRPALRAVESRQQSGDECVDQEHVLSWAISATLHRTAPPTTTAPPAVMLACAEGEYHTLPLEALTAALAERDIPVRMLGAAVPAASLRHAVTATHPAVVVLWSQSPVTASRDAVRALREHGARCVLAGPGWSRGRTAGAVHAPTLPAALELLTGIR